MAGFADQNADGTDPLDGFDTFFNDREYFKHFEIGWTGASQEAYYLNNVHLTLWHADERDELGVEDGWGGVLSFNHTIGDKWLAFARAGWAEDGGSLLERSVSIGGGYTPGGMATLGAGSQLGFASIGGGRTIACSVRVWMTNMRRKSTTAGKWPRKLRSHRAHSC